MTEAQYKILWERLYMDHHQVQSSEGSLHPTPPASIRLQLWFRYRNSRDSDVKRAPGPSLCMPSNATPSKLQKLKALAWNFPAAATAVLVLLLPAPCLLVVVHQLVFLQSVVVADFAAASAARRFAWTSMAVLLLVICDLLSLGFVAAPSNGKALTAKSLSPSWQLDVHMDHVHQKLHKTLYPPWMQNPACTHARH